MFLKHTLFFILSSCGTFPITSKMPSQIQSFLKISASNEKKKNDYGLLSSSIVKQGEYQPFSYAHGVHLDEVGSFIGGNYSPSEDRIYLAPYNHGSVAQAKWLYIDCRTQRVQSMPNPYPATDFANGYHQGAYDPIQNRIYFTPTRQTMKPKWHFIDCTNGVIGEYTHGRPPSEFGGAESYAYFNAVYSPTQKRIYFMPAAQTVQPLWHYLDCTTGQVIAYAHGQTISGIWDGVYNPLLNRIHLFPYQSESVWFDLDCETGLISPVHHGRDLNEFVDSSSYWGSVYNARNHRIYLMPRRQSGRPIWHFINAKTGQVEAYAHGRDDSEFHGGVYSYTGGVFSPLDNLIFLVPGQQSSREVWHVIDCTSNEVRTYENPFLSSDFVSSPYMSGVYAPLQNIVFFLPWEQLDKPFLHGIRFFSRPSVPREWINFLSP
jgi:hypothetical protein